MKSFKPKQSTPVDQGIGSRIALLRTANGLSQSQLADALGISFQQVQKYEAGKNRIGAGRLQAIADRLGVPVSTFFEDTTQPPSDDAVELLLQSDGAIDLLRAYVSIQDDELRRSIVTMVKATLRVSKAGAAAGNRMLPIARLPAPPTERGTGSGSVADLDGGPARNANAGPTSGCEPGKSDGGFTVSPPRELPEAIRQVDLGRRRFLDHGEGPLFEPGTGSSAGQSCRGDVSAIGWITEQNREPTRRTGFAQTGRVAPEQAGRAFRTERLDIRADHAARLRAVVDEEGV